MPMAVDLPDIDITKRCEDYPAGMEHINLSGDYVW